MRQTSQEIADEYSRIRARSTEDPGTAGDEGEENWAHVLRQWLPSQFHVVTKGRILGANGEASPQIDVLVLDPAYPQRLHSKKMYLAGGVIAAFECKLTLRAKHLKKCIETSKIVHSFSPPRTGTFYKELFSGIIYGVLAHSQEFAATEESALIKIGEQLFEYDLSEVTHPRQMIDLVCIADLGVWTSMKFPVANQIYLEEEGRRGLVQRSIALGPLTAYLSYSIKGNTFDGFSPIGFTYFEVMKRLARESPLLRRFVEYLRDVGFAQGGGGQQRTYPNLAYAEDTMQAFQQREFRGGNLYPMGMWDEFLIT